MAASSSRRHPGGRGSSSGLGSELPVGSCHFRDLNLGVRAPVCGCKRFWLNESRLHIQHDHQSFCFCGHHACFHDAFASQHYQGQETERLLNGHEVNVENRQSDRRTAPPEIIHAPEDRPSSRQAEQPCGLGIRADARSQSQSISTRVWKALNDFARDQDGDNTDTASKLPSTAAPSIVDFDRLSPNRIMQDRLQLYHPMGPPPLQVPQNTTNAGPAEEYSATEVATPSIAGTPDFRGGIPSSSSPMRVSPGHLRPGRINMRNVPGNVPKEEGDPTTLDSIPTQPLAVPQLEPGTMSAKDMQSMLQALGRRLDVVENLSFSQVPVEEIQERFDLFDGRLIDLEQWRTDLDRERDAFETTNRHDGKTRRLLPDERASFGSDDSFDVNAAAHTEAVVLAALAANAETNPRIEDLENRVTDLEAHAGPTFTRPWEVQVVLLPWGRDLRGIWFSAQDSTLHSVRSATQMSEEWTLAQSAASLSFNTSFGGGWTTESIEAWANEANEWLSPKACGPTGLVFQRLESRGFVRTISITASDSQHILAKIKEAFKSGNSRDSDKRVDATQFQAMSEQHIPLRKVRKSSRLRFLTPAEMITSASWNASFLDASVFMKVKADQRRLYITTPEAYTQPAGLGWSWQRIRELPMYNASGEEQAAQANNIAIEACWTYNDALDRSSSFYSSVSASNESQWSTRSQVAEEDGENGNQHPPSPWSSAPQLHRRTLSLPSSQFALEAPVESVSKRRVASFETGTSVPTLLVNSNAENLVKRRRISASPGFERRGVNFTPRWSREPPSPFTSDVAAEAKSQGTRRGATPFAYATPHSNSNILVHLDSLVGDGGDTEADTEMAAARSEHGEDEWHGVDDGANIDEVKEVPAEIDGEDPDDEEDEDYEEESELSDEDDEDEDVRFGVYGD